ncbi:Riboflavin-binding protein RibY [Rhodoplanes serenus]|jgi:NitT/TauT family transport system substrate-binding protein|uniref:Riboflavin-binding protein RibY n=1 Tax=Rhodoplanes serenus TaxID=200615 RepID=A0A3S4BIN7_9BRAD|nr:ABC transporter substrate-binding protein [Rhodoplanes serenus]VCU10873.1 Riboflavin-binding protein RibY [Rhodoplanes serenus]
MTRVPTLLRRRLLRPAAGLAAISAVVLSGAALSTTAVAARAEVVTLGQATATSLTFGPVFAAVELGYFEQEKIELRFLNFQGASVLLPQVANKSVMIGFPGPDPLIVSHQPGRDPMPVKFFYNAARSSIWEFLVLQDSPLKTLADLRGKVIGVGALANANVPITRAMLKDIGLGPNDYSFMAIGVGAPAFRATLTKEVDSYNTFDTNIAAFETTGAKLRYLPIEPKYRNLFSNGFVAHLDTLKEKPELIAGFGRAFTKGVLVCETNPDFCVRNFYKHNPSLKPSGGSEAEVLSKGRHVLASRMARYLAFPEGQPRRFGAYDPAVWKDFVEILHAGGELSGTEIDVSKLYTDAFVPKFNDFDVEAIRAKAKTLK